MTILVIEPSTVHDYFRVIEPSTGHDYFRVIEPSTGHDYFGDRAIYWA